jgi:cellulose synthase/poly-beta-1,6-N-acetylglucosamine synthase-like glycosyltransferase
MFSIGALLFFLIPCYLLIWILSGLKALREKRDHLPIQDTNITLIIAFRDEASQIPKLLESLSKLNLLEGDEIYLVDDHSSDGGISSEYNLRSEIQVLESPTNQTGSKKNALSIGIHHAKNEWILTSDADCTFAPEWINTWRKKLHSSVNMFIGPVYSEDYKFSFPALFHHAENACLQVIALASAKHKQPLICSGANLLFRKSIWEQVGGYEQHKHIPSGDDVLLMQSFQEYAPSKVFVHFEKSNVVRTQSVTNWKSWFLQRRRWASKSGHLANNIQKIYALLLIVWVFIFPIALWFFGPLYFLMLIPEMLIIGFLSRELHSKFTYWMWPIFRLLYPCLLVLMPFTVFIWRSTWKKRSFQSVKTAIH